ncbi:hypothetical protein Bca101_074460 [Brassica carinata]
MASFARRAMSLAQIPSARVPASVCQRRGLAGAADHHGSTKVDFWKQPTNPGNWKEEHFVLISLSGWGLLFYSGYKLFTGGKGDDEFLLFKSVPPSRDYKSVPCSALVTTSLSTMLD